jgi:hypothetical protein
VANIGDKDAPKKEPSLKKEVYELPADRGLAMLAAASLSNIATAGKAEVGIVPADEWQAIMVKGFDALKISTGTGKKLSLPISLKGIHAQEWYARSAGYIGIKQEPVHITSQGERSSKYVVVTPDAVLPEAVLKRIQRAGKDMVLLDPACKFQEAALVFRDSMAYVGPAGWLQHLAKWTNVPAFVFFDGRSPKEFGWDDQENHSEGDFSDVEKFLGQLLLLEREVTRKEVGKPPRNLQD